MSGAVYLVPIVWLVEGDCIDNILGSQTGCDDDGRKPHPVQLHLEKGQTDFLEVSLLFTVLRTKGSSSCLAVVR